MMISENGAVSKLVAGQLLIVFVFNLISFWILCRIAYDILAYRSRKKHFRKDRRKALFYRKFLSTFLLILTQI